MFQLSGDLTCGGERFDEKRAFRVTHVFGTDVEVYSGQGEIFRKRAVMRNDAGTVRRAQCVFNPRRQNAHTGLKPLGGADHIDLAHNALPDPAL